MIIGFLLVFVPLYLMGYFYKMLLPNYEALNMGGVKFIYCLIAPLVAFTIAFSIAFGLGLHERVLMAVSGWTVVSFIAVYFTIKVKEQ